MNIAIIEPFAIASHKRWFEGLQKFSTHTIRVFSLSGSNWKWRMHGAAISLGSQLVTSRFRPDLFLLTDMCDLALFRSLLPASFRNVPHVIYFHENQLSYPWSEKDMDVALGRDRHYGFINYSSALAADAVVWSSDYHSESFFSALEKFLPAFPDHQNLQTIDVIRKKSSVLYPGIEMPEFSSRDKINSGSPPLVLWNHRWEYDKNPDTFFHALFKLKESGVAFSLAVLGEMFSAYPNIFDEAKEKLASNIVQWGFEPDEKKYHEWLLRSDVLPVTSIQDFFGYSVIEAVWCGVQPLLPGRLAYPEHFKESYFFYHDEEQFVTMLDSVLTNPKPMNKSERFSLHRYDWSNMIQRYDSLFSTFALQSNQK